MTWRFAARPIKTIISPTTVTRRGAYTDQSWTPARVYAAYRLVLSLTLFIVFQADLPGPSLGHHEPALFLYAVMIFLMLAVVTPPLEYFITAERHWSWILWPLVGDIILLTLLIHASGGLGTPLTALLMVTVAAGNILLPGRRGLLITALAAILILLEQFFQGLRINAEPFQLTGAGLLGLSLFVVSLIVRQIADRLARSEALAEQQRQEIEQLEELNRQIVQRMRTGIVVFDAQLHVLLSNPSARNLFDGRLEGQPAPRELVDAFRQWQANPARTPEPVTVSPAAQTINMGFARLAEGGDSPVIAFLEDHSRVVQEAQQLKLASLGRMSATIAHEIRNPLSAIRHAAGLLTDDQRDDEDQRLLSMIENHVNRVDAIINDVLYLSRRPTGNVERRLLRDVLEEIRSRWLEQGIPENHLVIRENRPGVEIRFDMLQLTQVLDNLIGNARHHGGENSRITLEIGLHEATGLPRLRVLDDGPGVPEAARAQLFEPFFTTEQSGTGLGLFVCRELCEANQARLDYEAGLEGACFVITFSHPERVFE